MLGLSLLLILYSQIALADCPRDFAQMNPLQITYQRPLLLAPPPPAEVDSIETIANYIRQTGRDSMAKKVERWNRREESEMGEAILLAAKNGRWNELFRILDKTGPNLRTDLFALRREISEQTHKNAPTFAYDLNAVRKARPTVSTGPATYRYSAGEVAEVMNRYPALAKNIWEKSAKIADLELQAKVVDPLEIKNIKDKPEMLKRLSDKEKSMVMAVWNQMNDPKAAAQYVRELAEDAAVEMSLSQSPRAADALARGELIRNDVLKVLVKRHQTSGNSKFSTIVPYNGAKKPSTLTRKSSSNDDFREAVRQGPFFDKPFLGSRHGVDTHFLQIDYVSDVIWEASGGNPREFWDLLGSKRGIAYWVILFDSFGQKTLAKPEYFAHQISDLLKITD